jgi:hypothetical protein
MLQVGFSVRHEVQALAGPISSGKPSIFTSPTQPSSGGGFFGHSSVGSSPDEDRPHGKHGRQTGLAALARICNAGRLAPASSHEYTQVWLTALTCNLRMRSSGLLRNTLTRGMPVQAVQHGRVEVVGTARFTDAVRRLAKAVVLGLKAQQVWLVLRAKTFTSCGHCDAGPGVQGP